MSVPEIYIRKSVIKTEYIYMYTCIPHRVFALEGNFS